MRKLFKTAIPVAGILAAATVFAGCTSVKQADKLTVSDLFADAVNIIKKNNSLSVDGDVDMSVKMESSGLSFAVDVTGDAKMEADIKNDVVHSEFDSEIGTMGLSQSMLVENYVVRDGEKYISYTAKTTGDDQDKQWSYTIKDTGGFSVAEFLNKIDIKDDGFINALENATTDLVITGEAETIENKECYVVSGILQLNGDAINNFSSEHTTTVTDDKLDIKSVWYFAKDNHELKRAKLDLASSIKNINTDVFNIAFEPEKLNLTLDFSYDSTIEITVPEEIKENAKESVDSEHAIDLMMEM